MFILKLFVFILEMFVFIFKIFVFNCLFHSKFMFILERLCLLLREEKVACPIIINSPNHC